MPNTEHDCAIIFKLFPLTVLQTRTCTCFKSSELHNDFPLVQHRYCIEKRVKRHRRYIGRDWLDWLDCPTLTLPVTVTNATVLGYWETNDLRLCMAQPVFPGIRLRNMKIISAVPLSGRQSPRCQFDDPYRMCKNCGN